jgi:hypothetical protein
VTRTDSITPSIQLTHSGGRVLRSGGLNHYNPLCPLMFFPNSLDRQPLRPPPNLRIRAGAFHHPAGGFLPDAQRVTLAELRPTIPTLRPTPLQNAGQQGASPLVWRRGSILEGSNPVMVAVPAMCDARCHT